MNLNSSADKILESLWTNVWTVNHWPSFGKNSVITHLVVGSILRNNYNYSHFKLKRWSTAEDTYGQISGFGLTRLTKSYHWLLCSSSSRHEHLSLNSERARDLIYKFPVWFNASKSDWETKSTRQMSIFYGLWVCSIPTRRGKRLHYSSVRAEPIFRTNV